MAFQLPAASAAADVIAFNVQMLYGLRIRRLTPLPSSWHSLFELESLPRTDNAIAPSAEARTNIDG
jgi:hypothetical protein